MVAHRNRTERGHILTIEDPVEFIHQDELSFVNQREVGSDTPSFASALRHTLRQDPDVILVSEFRDAETMELGLAAAETDHLLEELPRGLPAAVPGRQHVAGATDHLHAKRRRAGGELVQPAVEVHLQVDLGVAPLLGHLPAALQGERRDQAPRNVARCFRGRSRGWLRY